MQRFIAWTSVLMGCAKFVTIRSSRKARAPDEAGGEGADTSVPARHSDGSGPKSTSRREGAEAVGRCRAASVTMGA